MNDTEAYELTAKILGDRVVTYLHEKRLDILRVSLTYEKEWTQEDLKLIRFCLLSLTGLLFEERI